MHELKSIEYFLSTQLSCQFSLQVFESYVQQFNTPVKLLYFFMNVSVLLESMKTFFSTFHHSVKYSLFLFDLLGQQPL